MIEDDPFIVSLYLHGKDLDPVYVSAQLGNSPTRSHFKGQKEIISPNREITKKAGVWVLSATTTSKNLSDHIDELAEKIKVDQNFIEGIVGVEEAYIDIFMCTKCSKDSCTSEFEMSKTNVAALNKFGLPVKFTITFVEEE